MKTGILTFHDADNYGALLQAYALQQTLNKLGIANEFVAIEREQKEHAKQAAGPMAIFMKRVACAGEKRKQLFEEFRKEYLEISTVYRKSEADRINDKYSFFWLGVIRYGISKFRMWISDIFSLLHQQRKSILMLPVLVHKKYRKRSKTGVGNN